MIIVKKMAPATRTKKISSADEVRKTGSPCASFPCVFPRLPDCSSCVSGELRISASRKARTSDGRARTTPASAAASVGLYAYS